MSISVSVCVLLAFLAWVLPIDSQIGVGGLSLHINPELDLLGRYLILEDTSRPILIFLFGMAAFWFLGAYFTYNHRYFWPLGLMIVSLLVGVLAVQPFYYSALFVEVVVLLSIPVLYPPGTRIAQGGSRILIYQSLALPVFLFAGWFVAGIDANPGNESLINAAVVFLGLGIAFWLAVFPFYTWIPLLLEETHVYCSSFIINMLSAVSLLTVLNFVNSFEWLRDYALLPQVLRLVSILMVFSAGIWSIFEKKISRLFGYSIILETGNSLVALSLLNADGYHLYLALLLPRMIAVGVWTICMAELFEKNIVLVEDLSGLFHRKPLLVMNFLVAYLALGGFPLLAIFPLRYMIYEILAQQSFVTVVWLFAGHILFLITGFRIIYRVFLFSENEVKIEEKWPLMVLASLGAFSLFLLGFFPNWIIQWMAGLLQNFPKLVF